MYAKPRILGYSVSLTRCACQDQELEVCHLPDTTIKTVKLANSLERLMSLLTSAVDAHLDPMLTKVRVSLISRTSDVKM